MPDCMQYHHMEVHPKYPELKTFIASIPLAASPTTSISRDAQSIDSLKRLLADCSSSISITLYIL